MPIPMPVAHRRLLRSATAVAIVAIIGLRPSAATGQGGREANRAEAFASFATLFSYDATLPLNARTFDRVDSLTFVREKVVFSGWRGSRVPGFIAIPKNARGRRPVIVLVDGIGGWKERWWQATSWNRGRILIDSLLGAGFAVAMVDAPSSGERTFENDFQTAEAFVRKPAQWRDMGIQNAIEQRRLLDYLATRSDIDTTRVGMLGLSHGGLMTFALAAVDSRIRAGVAGLTPMQNIPDALHPMNYAGQVRQPMLMLASTNDTWYTRPQVERAFETIASTDKNIIWYEGGHRVPESYAGAATSWFRRVLR